MNARRTAKEGSRAGNDINHHPATRHTYLLRGMVFRGCDRRTYGNARKRSTYYMCWPSRNRRDPTTPSTSMALSSAARPALPRSGMPSANGYSAPTCRGHVATLAEMAEKMATTAGHEPGAADCIDAVRAPGRIRTYAPASGGRSTARCDRASTCEFHRLLAARRHVGARMGHSGTGGSSVHAGEVGTVERAEGGPRSPATGVDLAGYLLTAGSSSLTDG